ncbi:MAG: DUF6802 family protein [Mycobacteriaceae bacterium]|uniref:DUF6802 family protein n=1 Tax=Corynebacterium sp. TaxID=1720 RepID=UPI003F9D1349
MTDWDSWDGLPGAQGLEPAEGTEGMLPGDGLLLDLDGVSYALPASADVPGVEESVTLTDDSGMTICSDTDGDGLVDYMSVVTFDGGWSAWRLQASMAGESSVSSITLNGSHGEPDNSGIAGNPREGRGTGGVVPPATPGNGIDNWNTVGWECVDRGKWG